MAPSGGDDGVPPAAVLPNGEDWTQENRDGQPNDSRTNTLRFFVIRSLQCSPSCF